MLIPLHEQRNNSVGGIDSTVAESCFDRMPLTYRLKENSEPLGLSVQRISPEGESSQGLISPFKDAALQIENGFEITPSVELQFIPRLASSSHLHQKNEERQELKNLSTLRNGYDGEVSVSLRLGEPEAKRRKHLDSLSSIKESSP
ncbi:hypothetical protein SDJN02_04550, partial [Cucurbita argyrosperma subsp. argyrosperma]